MTESIDARSDAARGVSRRTLVAGAAWAAPVVIGLAALPAVAASVGGISFTSATATDRGSGTVRFTVSGKNTTSKTVTATLTAVYSGPGKSGATTSWTGGIPAGQTGSYDLDWSVAGYYKAGEINSFTLTLSVGSLSESQVVSTLMK